MDYFKKAIESMDFSKLPTLGSIAKFPRMRDFYSTKNKNRERWEIALDQLRFEERATRRRNEERRA